MNQIIAGGNLLPDDMILKVRDAVCQIGVEGV